MESTSTPTILPRTTIPSKVPSPFPSATPEPTQTATPTQPPPLPDLDVPIPSFLYFLDGTLFEQIGNQPPQLITSLPQTNSVLANAMLEGQIIVLVEPGLFTINLQDKTSSPILSLDMSARFGRLIIVPEINQLIYQIAVEDPDPNSSSGYRTHIGIYDPMTGTGRPIVNFPGGAQILGLSADHEYLYLVHQGQDPTPGEVITISIETGEEVRDVPAEATGLISPKRDFSVATGQHDTGEGTEGTLEGVADFTATWGQSFFKEDGEWILIRYYGKEEAAFIHLPTQTAISFTFPSTAYAVIVGWSEP